MVMDIDFPIVLPATHIRRKKTTELDYLSTFSIRFSKATSECEISLPCFEGEFVLIYSVSVSVLMAT